MIEKYILIDKTPVQTHDLEIWGEFFNEIRVVKQETIEGIFISTVFLGFNHNWGPGLPVLFETMIFGGEHNHYQDRYCTWEEAERGHEKAIKLVEESLTKNQKDGTTDNKN